MLNARPLDDAGYYLLFRYEVGPKGLTLWLTSYAAVRADIRAGKLKGIAVTSEKRSELAPDVPTIAEQGFPTFDATVWIGLLSPAGLPQDVLAKIAGATQKGMADPELRKRLGASGFQIVGGTPEQFASFIRSESKKWGDIVKLTGAKVD